MPSTRQLEVERDGYSIVPVVLPPKEVEKLILELEQFTPRRSRAGIRHLLANPVVEELANDRRLRGLAREILGADAFPFRATLFDKSANSNWLVSWHQDTALPLAAKSDIAGWGPWSVKGGVTYARAPAKALEQVLALRLHLNDSTQENGPLRVLPGTHYQGILSDQQIETAVLNAEPFTCLVPQGGVILMRPLIVHASSKSHSMLPRRVLHLEYATAKTISAPLGLAFA